MSTSTPEKEKEKAPSTPGMFRVKLNALSDTDKNRLVCILLNSAASDKSAEINWKQAAIDFGSASGESMQKMWSNTVKKMNAAIATAEKDGDGNFVMPAGEAATPKSNNRGGRKRKEPVDGQEDSTPKKRATPKKSVETGEDADDGINDEPKSASPKKRGRKKAVTSEAAESEEEQDQAVKPAKKSTGPKKSAGKDKKGGDGDAADVEPAKKSVTPKKSANKVKQEAAGSASPERDESLTSQASPKKKATPKKAAGKKSAVAAKLKQESASEESAHSEESGENEQGEEEEGQSTSAKEEEEAESKSSEEDGASV